MNDDDTNRIHKRISDLSWAIIFTSVSVIILALSLLCFNLPNIVHEWSRVF